MIFILYRPWSLLEVMRRLRYSTARTDGGYIEREREREREYRGMVGVEFNWDLSNCHSVSGSERFLVKNLKYFHASFKYSEEPFRLCWLMRLCPGIKTTGGRDGRLGKFSIFWIFPKLTIGWWAPGDSGTSRHVLGPPSPPHTTSHQGIWLILPTGTAHFLQN